MQNRKQAIGYIVYALLKWGVSIVEIKKIVDKLLEEIPEDEVIDNYTNTRYLEGYSNEVVFHYAPQHFDEEGKKRHISSMLSWAFNDYTIQEAGEMFEKFNELVNVRMSFNHFF